MNRYLADYIKKDLRRKAVLLSGPRQVGKTTFAKALIAENGEYLNYDIVSERKVILAQGWRKDASIVVLDEVHKYRKWKNLLKGVIDQYQNQPPLLVTGSAKLEVFRKAGDALTGRTFAYHMHPIDIAEACSLLPGITSDMHLANLLHSGGFPESFFNPEDAQRLLTDRISTVLRDDVPDLSRVSEMKTLELLVELLRERVGGQVVYSNLSKDLSVSAPTVKAWIDLLEKMYLIFLVRPFASNSARSLRKEPKCYFFDGSAALNGDGAKLENVVALALLKWIDLERDTKGRVVELNYYRDTNGREVDFVLAENRKPLACIEVKSSEESPSASLKYLAERIKPRYALQLVRTMSGSGRDYGPVMVRPLADWLKKIEL